MQDVNMICRLEPILLQACHLTYIRLKEISSESLIAGRLVLCIPDAADSTTEMPVNYSFYFITVEDDAASYAKLQPGAKTLLFHIPGQPTITQRHQRLALYVYASMTMLLGMHNQAHVPMCIG